MTAFRPFSTGVGVVPDPAHPGTVRSFTPDATRTTAAGRTLDRRAVFTHMVDVLVQLSPCFGPNGALLRAEGGEVFHVVVLERVSNITGSALQIKILLCIR
jgi:hypothetical protein